KEAIEQAKRYAERRGLSLSRVVERYFLRLGETEEPPREKLTGVCRVSRSSVAAFSESFVASGSGMRAVPDWAGGGGIRDCF
ncbi:MAG: DUF6364 family protein, partial [Acidimicrobiia bacterium]